MVFEWFLMVFVNGFLMVRNLLLYVPWGCRHVLVQKKLSNQMLAERVLNVEHIISHSSGFVSGFHSVPTIRQ